MEKDSIKMFVTCAVPVFTCNLNCEYCYLRNFKHCHKGTLNFILPPEKLIKYLTKKRLGGTCYFNFCGDGETMLHPQIIKLIFHLTKEGHFCDIITNGTISKRFDELVEFLSMDQRQRILVKFSFHWRELARNGLLKIFDNNVEKCKQNGISYSIEMTPEDALIPYIDTIKEYSVNKFGALPHITVARDTSDPKLPLLTKLTKNEYERTWAQFNSKMFNFKIKHFGVKHTEFCYAGNWSIYLNLNNGVYYQCYGARSLGNITDEGALKLSPVGKCRLPHCFNCHSFLTLGTIPELDTPTYTEMRDQLTKDGKHWVNETGRLFFSTKLKDNNILINQRQKFLIYFKELSWIAYHSLKGRMIKVMRLIHETEQ